MTITDHGDLLLGAWLAVPVPNPNWVAESRRDQGLPDRVVDPAAVRRLAALLEGDASPEQASDGAPVVRATTPPGQPEGVVSPSSTPPTTEGVRNSHEKSVTTNHEEVRART